MDMGICCVQDDNNQMKLTKKKGSAAGREKERLSRPACIKGELLQPDDLGSN